MREKPVPLRVDKDLNSMDITAPMDELPEDTPVEKETRFCQEQPDIPSKELPSMVSIVPLNKPHVFDVNNIGMFQQTFQLRPRFETPEEFEFLDKESVSESQKQAVKFGVRVFRDWLFRQGSTLKSLEDMTRHEIANALEQFYLTARRPNGTQYKKNTLKSIKHSLDLYLRSSPLKKDFSISSDFDFRQVNRTLDNLPEDADNNRFPQCTRETILKLYKAGQLGLVTTEDPQVLIQTVWFYIASYFFSNIDKRMLRELTWSMLVLSKDEVGQEYYQLDYKTPDRCRSDIRKACIYAKVGSICCPVTIIKKYLEHRNPRNEVLFQHPKKISSAIWYSHLPLGKNKHMDIIKAMCLNAGIDPPLTGRCIRSYVQELLRDCDQVVNNMFHLGSISSLPSMTLQTVILPKGSEDQSTSHQVPESVSSHFPLSGPRLVSSGSSSTSPSPLNTIVVPDDHTESPTGTTATTELSISSGYSNSDVSRIVIPCRRNLSAINGFAESFNHFKGGDFPSGAGHSGDRVSTIVSHISEAPHRYSHIDSDPRSRVREVVQRHNGIPPSVDTATQTEPDDKEWSESAYNKADLKTRNKMRLQARKSLLSFLEELNEISDGHATELFHEIVQEDMNMWKSIAAPVLSR